MNADTRQLVVREAIGLVVVFGILVGIQLAFDELAPAWALAVFVVGWIVFRTLDLRQRHPRSRPPAT